MENASLGDAICRTITIFFSDIRNFTSMTEKMHVSQVLERHGQKKKKKKKKKIELPQKISWIIY
jgi:hypothetical protein